MAVAGSLVGNGIIEAGSTGCCSGRSRHLKGGRFCKSNLGNGVVVAGFASGSSIVGTGTVRLRSARLNKRKMEHVAATAKMMMRRNRRAISKVAPTAWPSGEYGYARLSGTGIIACVCLKDFLDLAGTSVIYFDSGFQGPKCPGQGRVGGTFS